MELSGEAAFQILRLTPPSLVSWGQRKADEGGGQDPGGDGSVATTVGINTGGCATNLEK